MISQSPFFSGPELQALEKVLGPDIGRTEFAIGDLTPEFFFSPKKPIQLGEASLVWGAAFQFPTATDEEVGTGKWSAGPGFVVFLSDRSLHITTGFLILNLWAGDENRANVNAMTLQPFVNYNLPKGWYLTSSPLITANWEANSDNRWTLPIGGGIGRIFKIGNQPINAQINAYSMSLRPTTLALIGNYARSGHSFSRPIEQ